MIVPLLLLLAGIVLPASRMGLGEPGLQSPFVAIFEDDCEEFYAALAVPICGCGAICRRSTGARRPGGRQTFC